jgi:hypothetical protein
MFSCCAFVRYDFFTAIITATAGDRALGCSLGFCSSLFGTGRLSGEELINQTTVITGSVWREHLKHRVGLAVCTDAQVTREGVDVLMSVSVSRPCRGEQEA